MWYRLLPVAATPSVKITKTFDFRGTLRAWTNRYHFNGGTPADNAHWETLFDAIVGAEKHIFKSDITIVDATGYAAGSDLPVHSKTYTTVGDGSFPLWFDTPGQTAALLRYSTTARSVKNHPIYLFNYFHGAGWLAGADADTLDTGMKSAIEAYADAWMAGFSDGTITAVRAGPNGATATSRFVHPELTHRDFPV
jgi:hypothetical protein